ncbi:hypothetical protein [Nocardia sp. CNY236]|uniref:hypothetical protein n=1 Tax=Nocardia sp. CNY236 TaxID=1169152 RepID=UPI0004090DFB|nr:hypothetical protein [Nocardia sp. CNY236]
MPAPETISPHEAPDTPTSPEAAHYVMQQHLSCGAGTCRRKRHAYRTLVAAGVIRPDARITRAAITDPGGQWAVDSADSPQLDGCRVADDLKARIHDLTRLAAALRDMPDDHTTAGEDPIRWDRGADGMFHPVYAGGRSGPAFTQLQMIAAGGAR